MDKIKEFLAGKKTYIIFAVAFALGGLKAVDIDVPIWVIQMLTALGLITLRAGVKKAGG